MTKIITRYWLFNKRLFKKISFIFILCLVPCLVGGLKIVSHQESGILRIAICLSNPVDELSEEIVAKILEKDSMLQYVMCSSEEEAIELVQQYDADAAWIFTDNMKKSLEQGIDQKKKRSVVKVVEREDSVPLVLSREILCSCIYPYFSYSVYRDFVLNELGLENINEEQLIQAYNSTLPEDNLFEMTYVDGQRMEETSYLLTPVRGILSIWLVLCGFAAMMYHIRDEQNGCFAWIPTNKRLQASYVTSAVLLSDAVIIMMISCYMTGIFNVWYKEFRNILVFGCCIIGFTSLLRLICRTMERLGSCIPFLLTAVVVLCPVFIDIKGWKAVQMLLPPYYYLKSIHNDYYFWGMAVYSVLLFVLCKILSIFHKQLY